MKFFASLFFILTIGSSYCQNLTKDGAIKVSCVITDDYNKGTRDVEFQISGNRVVSRFFMPSFDIENKIDESYVTIDITKKISQEGWYDVDGGKMWFKVTGEKTSNAGLIKVSLIKTTSTDQKSGNPDEIKISGCGIYITIDRWGTLTSISRIGKLRINPNENVMIVLNSSKDTKIVYPQSINIAK